MMNLLMKKDKETKDIKERDEMLRILSLAHKERKEKESYFQAVTDPDLVDYAIYEMEATRLKYIFLLKQMRKELDEKQPEINSSLVTNS